MLFFEQEQKLNNIKVYFCASIFTARVNTYEKGSFLWP